MHGNGIDSTSEAHAQGAAAAAWILVVDDHPLVARGFAEYMLTACGVGRVEIARNGAECMQRIVDEGAPELAVIDFWLPEGAADALLAELRVRCPHTRLLVVSGDDDPAVVEHARQAGANGYLHKQAPPEVFSQAVAALRAGGGHFCEFGAPTTPSVPRELPVRAQELGLTERQGQVLGMMLRGLPNKRIALDLAISEQTVKEHVTNILARLGVANRMEAIDRMRGRKIDAGR